LFISFSHIINILFFFSTNQILILLAAPHFLTKFFKFGVNFPFLTSSLSISSLAALKSSINPACFTTTPNPDLTILDPFSPP